MSKMAKALQTTIKIIKDDPLKYLNVATEKELETIIKHSANIYYNTGDSIFGDELYDMIKDKLQEINPNNPLLKQVGAPVQDDEYKVNLPYHMGSMDKIKPITGEVEKWKKTYKGPYVISDKLDGISGLLVIKNGKMSLYKRGEEDIGTNISHLIHRMSVFKKIKLDNIKDEYTVRGELIMDENKFKKYSNEKKNARNMVAGLTNAKNTKQKTSELNDIDFVVYELIKPSGLSPTDQFIKMKTQGFDVVNYQIIDDISDSILSNLLKERKKKSIYKMDGIIVTPNKFYDRETSGNPKYAVAFKDIDEDQIAEATVTSIEWNVSKDGYIKPTVLINPVQLPGVTISRATGYNAKYIKDNNLGTGAIIKIIRSGDVIPKIMEIIKPAKIPEMPKIPYIWNETGVDIIVVPSTGKTSINKQQLVKNLTYFFKKLKIQNINDATIEKMVDIKLDTILKILKATESDFQEVENFGEKMAKKVFTNIHKGIKNVELDTLMAASNIFGRGIGETKIALILKKYPNILDIKESDEKLIEMIKTIEGFEDKTATRFVEGLPKFKKFISEIPMVTYIIPTQTNKSNGMFQGKTIIFTGFRNKEWENKIIEEGGKIGNSVTKETSFVVAKDPTEISSKLTSAREKNIKIISMDEFQNEIE